MKFRSCHNWSLLRTDSRDCSMDTVPAVDCTADPEFWASVWSLQATEKIAAEETCNSNHVVGRSVGNVDSRSVTPTSPAKPNASASVNGVTSRNSVSVERSPLMKHLPTQSTASAEQTAIPRSMTPRALQFSQQLPEAPLVLSGARRAILTRSLSVGSQRVVPISSSRMCLPKHSGVVNPSITVNPTVSILPLNNSVMSSFPASTSGSLIGSSPPLTSITPSNGLGENNFSLIKSSNPFSSLARVTAFERPLRSALRSERSFECHTTLENHGNRRFGGQGTRTVIIKSVFYDSTVELDDRCRAAVKFDTNGNNISMGKNGSRNNNHNYYYNNNNSITPTGCQLESTTASPWAASCNSTNSLDASIGGSSIVFNGTYPIDEPITDLSSRTEVVGCSRPLRVS